MSRILNFIDPAEPVAPALSAEVAGTCPTRGGGHLSHQRWRAPVPPEGAGACPTRGGGHLSHQRWRAPVPPEVAGTCPTRGGGRLSHYDGRVSVRAIDCHVHL